MGRDWARLVGVSLVAVCRLRPVDCSRSRPEKTAKVVRQRGVWQPRIDAVSTAPTPRNASRGGDRPPFGGRPKIFFHPLGRVALQRDRDPSGAPRTSRPTLDHAGRMGAYVRTAGRVALPRDRPRALTQNPQNPNKTRLFFTSHSLPRASSPPQPRPLSPRSPDLHVNKPPLPILSILLILSKHSLPLLPIYTAKNRRLPPLTRRGNYAIISVV